MSNEFQKLITNNVRLKPKKINKKWKFIIFAIYS